MLSFILCVFFSPRKAYAFSNFESIFLVLATKVLINKEAILGIRPEHLTNAKQHIHDMYEDFNAKVKVLEPMGMDTMVFFDISEAEVCARCDPKSVGKVQSDMTFTIDKSQIHLIDIKTNKVI